MGLWVLTVKRGVSVERSHAFKLKRIIGGRSVNKESQNEMQRQLLNSSGKNVNK